MVKKILLFFLVAPLVFADQTIIPHNLTNGSVADAAKVQENFDVLAAESNENDSRISEVESIIKLDNSPFEPGSLDAGVVNGAFRGDEQQGNFLVGPDSTPLPLSGLESAWNTSLGVEALANLQSGGRNVAIGYRALRDAVGDGNNSISRNVAIGAFALERLIDYPGIANVAIGSRAMFKATTAQTNVGIGEEALQQLTTGFFNVGVGGIVLRGTTTGFRNTAFGHRALGDNVTGFDNTAIGYRADATASDLQNSTVIGANAVVSESNSVQIGNQNVSEIYLGRRAEQTENTPPDANLHLQGSVHSGEVVYPNIDGMAGQVLTTDGNGALSWANDTVASVDNSELIERIAFLEKRLEAQKHMRESRHEQILAVVQSQQEQIAQLQQMVEYKFAER